MNGKRSFARQAGRTFRGMAVAALLLLSLAQYAAAYDVQIHGYGNQDFIMSNRTDYFDAAKGNWDEHSMSLVFTANVTDDTSVWAKIFADKEKTTMEWLYVDKKLPGNISARAGQMKLPLGLVNLTRDNKFLHLTEIEPSIYSDFVEVVQENFRGVSAEWNRDWLTVEAFGGAPVLEENAEATTVLTAPNELTTTSAEERTRKLLGARLRVGTPLEGLHLMLSGSRYNEELTVNEQVMDLVAGTTTVNKTLIDGVEKVWIGSLEYEHHDLEVKAEYARKSGLDEFKEKIISYYGEAGYTFLDSLTPYVRYDYITNNIDDKGALENHQIDTTVGIGYKINEYLKFKVEEHFIKGYALVLAQRGEDVDPATIQTAPRWNMFVAGINFMF